MNRPRLVAHKCDHRLDDDGIKPIGFKRQIEDIGYPEFNLVFYPFLVRALTRPINHLLRDVHAHDVATKSLRDVSEADPDHEAHSQDIVSVFNVTERQNLVRCFTPTDVLGDTDLGLHVEIFDAGWRVRDGRHGVLSFSPDSIVEWVIASACELRAKPYQIL